MGAIRNAGAVLTACVALAGCGDNEPAPRSAGDEAEQPSTDEQADDQADLDEAREIIATESSGNPAEANERIPPGPAGDGAGAAAQEERVGQDVTVVGRAANAKLGAVVVDGDGVAYYIDGLDAWDDALLDETVEVSGVLQRKKLAPDPVVGPNGEVSAGMVGDATVIENATWKRAP